ncbi:MAG: hypothetical protein JF618_08370 [Leifsonia sp.]|nr:hypothetical protein [Leifsonia sp.]
MLDDFFGLIRAVPVPDDAELLYGDDELSRLRERNLRRYLEIEQFTSVREVEAGVLPGLELPPQPQAPWEASSRVVWETMRDWRGPLPLSWPIYPHHPFIAGRPQTNRTPRSSEVRQGAPVALELIRALGVETIVAVGRKAQGALAEAGIEAPAVRHPAQGGARMFAEQLIALNRAMLDA